VVNGRVFTLWRLWVCWYVPDEPTWRIVRDDRGWPDAIIFGRRGLQWQWLQW
jgi:hypothetical protein